MAAPRTRPSLRRIRSLPLLVALALALGVSGCADRPRLVIELRGGSLDLAAHKPGASVNLALLDGSTGQPIRGGETDIDGPSLGGEATLFEGIDLTTGATYRLRVIAEVPGGCGDSGGRAVGVSAPFSYDAELTRVPVYVDCADTSHLAGNVEQPRLFHTATWVPQGGPLGSVLLVGGARWQRIEDTSDLTRAKAYDSIERYDPDTDTSRLLSARLSRPRLYQQAVRLGDDSVVVLGGFDVVTVGGSGKVETLDEVERISGDRVSALTPLALPHALHTALLLADDRILVVGGVAQSPIVPTTKAELYDPIAGAPVGAVLDSAGGHLPGVATAVGDRALIFSGFPSATIQPQAQRFCLTSGCSCEEPCFDRLDGLPEDRTSLASALVKCPSGDGGAFYLVGGHRDERKWATPGPDTYYRDIYCVDVQTPGAPRLVGQLSDARAGHTVSVVRGGKQGARLFVAGGFGPNGTSYADAELIDVPCACPTQAGALGKSKRVSLNAARFSHTATVLPDGSVLLVGGLIGTESAERFVPDF